MGKRKQSSSSGELKNSSIPLNIHRYTNLPNLKVGGSSYLGIEHIQPFFPPIECLFKSEKLDFVNEYGIKFKNEIISILDKDKIRTSKGIEDIHIKKTMLLNPYKYMQGDYATIGLPTTTKQASEINSKLQNPNNAAYVGSIIASVLSESGCDHFPKVYGVFTGYSNNHTIDISDDYEELSEHSWFSQNIGKTFELKLHDNVKETIEFQHTRTGRLTLQLGDDISLGEVEELETQHVESNIGELKNVFEQEEESEESDDTSSVSTSYIYAVESCDCDDDDKQIISDEEEEGESFAWATFHNVPVQLTIMEKCEGTLYELMTFYNESEKHMAWMSQVIFALAYAQRNFGLVHNDLHANNILYKKTDKEFLYYNWSGIAYKVPTHGYLIKIIDFERGIMSLKINGMKEGKFFMSDHFAENDEAGGQYNYGPFYNSKFPEVKPNPSFDLARLATSLFWDFFPQGPAETSDSPLFYMFKKWLSLEDGTSVLFGKDEPRHDRYHGFTLYKAIARYCKDTAVPRKELMSLKTFFEVPNIPLGESVLVIDN